jgi:hypothetical protein
VNCDAKSIESTVGRTVAQAVLGAQPHLDANLDRGTRLKNRASRAAPADLGLAQRGVPNF